MESTSVKLKLKNISQEGMIFILNSPNYHYMGSIMEFWRSITREAYNSQGKLDREYSVKAHILGFFIFLDFSHLFWNFFFFFFKWHQHLTILITCDQYHLEVLVVCQTDTGLILYFKTMVVIHLWKHTSWMGGTKIRTILNPTQVRILKPMPTSRLKPTPIAITRCIIRECTAWKTRIKD